MSLLVSPQEAQSVTKNWIGGTGVWNDGANWSPPGVPASTDHIVIDTDFSTPSVVTLDIDFAIEGSLTINLNDALFIDTGVSLDNNSTIDNFGIIYNLGTINNDDAINNYLHGTIVSEGMLNNDGTIDNFDGFGNSGNISNSGTIENNGSFLNAASGNISNSGTIENNGSFLNTASGIINNLIDGTINNNSLGIFDNYNFIMNYGDIYNYSGGIFNNEGIIEGNPIIDLSNTPPIANDDSYSSTVDTTLDIGASGVLENDSDLDGDTLVVDSHTQPSDGSVVVDPDGSFTYTPDTGFTGDDSFNYTVSDGRGGNDTALVTIAVNPMPVAVAVAKIDMALVHQTPQKNTAVYHLGTSFGGLPVEVSLIEAQGIGWIPGGGPLYEQFDVGNGEVGPSSVGPGHLRVRINVPNANEYRSFQFVTEYEANGILVNGTIVVANENYKHWQK
jgi:hypothetical protein